MAKQEDIKRDTQRALSLINGELWNLYIKHGVKATSAGIKGYDSEEVLDIQFMEEKLTHRRYSIVEGRKR